MIFNVACDLKTQQMVWVPRSIHTDKQFTHEGEIKGFPAYQISRVLHLKEMQERMVK